MKNILLGASYDIIVGGNKICFLRKTFLYFMFQVDMKLEIQRVNQKINKIEELMTAFLEQASRNNLQVNQTSSLVSSPTTPTRVIIYVVKLS